MKKPNTKLAEHTEWHVVLSDICVVRILSLVTRVVENSYWSTFFNSVNYFAEHYCSKHGLTSALSIFCLRNLTLIWSVTNESAFYKDCFIFTRTSPLIYTTCHGPKSSDVRKMLVHKKVLLHYNEHINNSISYYLYFNCLLKSFKILKQYPHNVKQWNLLIHLHSTYLESQSCS